jgi:hypothetical protein
VLVQIDLSTGSLHAESTVAGGLAEPPLVLVRHLFRLPLRLSIAGVSRGRRVVCSRQIGLYGLLLI